MASFDNIELTDEEFFSFHNIDRQLFFRLIFHLRREPYEAMQVMALLLWLERTHKTSSFVFNILRYSDSVIKAVFEEALMVLETIERSEFQPNNNPYDIPILKSIVGKDNITLKNFHESRISVLNGVGDIVNQVCLRAFKDLIMLLSKYKAMNPFNYPQYLRNVFGQETIVQNYYPNFNVGEFTVPLRDPSHFPSLKGGVGVSSRDEGSSSNNDEYSLFPPVVGGGVIPTSERTIFLTFSKGYPISELEVRDFFRKAFGDIIEMLYMQDPVENEQSLYAKLVVRDARAMLAILGEQGKAKFAINGKHVWARKYIRKNNPNSPPSSPSNADN
ncbi:uncharacterized protein LOC141597231 [Silene latifolia]|uniref:uncharacterized protein LOC141597231 n=1 Tax=Silene latifolia TaxID=37657 RepID=UPI003D7771EA